MSKVVFEAPVKRFGKINPFKVERTYRFRPVEGGTGTWECVYTETSKRRNDDDTWTDYTVERVASTGKTIDVIRDHWRQGCHSAIDAMQILKLCDGHSEWEEDAIRFAWAREYTLKQLFDGELSYARFAHESGADKLRAAFALLEGKEWKQCDKATKNKFREAAGQIEMICNVPPIDATQLENTIWDPTPYLDQIK